MCRACIPGWGLLGGEFFEVWWGVSINALMGHESNFLIYSGSDDSTHFVSFYQAVMAYILANNFLFIHSVETEQHYHPTLQSLVF